MISWLIDTYHTGRRIRAERREAERNAALQDRMLDAQIAEMSRQLYYGRIWDVGTVPLNRAWREALAAKVQKP